MVCCAREIIWLKHEEILENKLMYPFCGSGEKGSSFGILLASCMWPCVCLSVCTLFQLQRLIQLSDISVRVNLNIVQLDVYPSSIGYVISNTNIAEVKICEVGAVPVSFNVMPFKIFHYGVTPLKCAKF